MRTVKLWLRSKIWSTISYHLWDIFGDVLKNVGKSAQKNRIFNRIFGTISAKNVFLFGFLHEIYVTDICKGNECQYVSSSLQIRNSGPLFWWLSSHEFYQNLKLCQEKLVYYLPNWSEIHLNWWKIIKFLKL